MTSSRIREMTRALKERFSVVLDAANWNEMEFDGGVAFVLNEVDSLNLLGVRTGDELMTAYEMESLNREFPPKDFPLNAMGVRELSNSWMAHFELVLVPKSKAWAIAVTPDMKAFLLAPRVVEGIYC